MRGDWRKPNGEDAYIAERATMAEACSHISNEVLATLLLKHFVAILQRPDAAREVLLAHIADVVLDIRAGERIRILREAEKLGAPCAASTS
jgi:hypothetical protein